MNTKYASALVFKPMAAKIGISLKSPSLKEIGELREKLCAAEETLTAIQNGEIDGLVVSGPAGQQVYTLKGAEQPYRVLVESMNEGALTISETGVILYCNAKFATLIGWPLERVMGRRFDTFLSIANARIFNHLLKTTDKRGNKTSLSLMSSKGLVPAQLSLIKIDLDRVPAFCAIATDLTEAYAVREAMLQKETGLRLIAEAAPVVLFTTDSEGKIKSALGGGLKILRGRIQKLIETPSKKTYDAILDGRTWYVTLEPLRRENLSRGFIGVALDVTAQRHESELVEIRHREMLQREFVANVSHEFRTPLSVIQAYTETLLDRRPSKTNSAIFLRTIQRHSQRLAGLVENLLFLSTLESGRLKPVRSVIDLSRLIHELVDDIRPIAARRGINILLEIPAELKAFVDGEQMRRVFQNIFTNGIKYSRNGGEVIISSKHTNDHISLDVADTGIGIDPKDLPRIFERFHRASNARSQAIKGTGLGLSIAKTLVEANGGKIWAESVLGRGSRFHILLPTHQSPINYPAARKTQGLTLVTRSIATKLATPNCVLKPQPLQAPLTNKI